MIIQSLTCRDFRNLQELTLSDLDEMNVIWGENAQGKTNLLEAIWLFTGAKSFRGAHDADFIRFGCDGCLLELSFFSEGIQKEAALSIKEKRTAVLNGNRLKTPSELAGIFHAVVFSPSDLGLVQNGPAGRRRFLDLAIGQLTPSYIPLLRDYLRAVIQRNRIIKDYRYDPSLAVMLEVFENEIADKGIRIIRARQKYIASLQEILPALYDGLSSGRERLTIEYVSTVHQDFLKELEQARKEDMLTGSTSIGPHRDDVLFQLNGISARTYGSQGQKRSVALAVRMAEAEWIQKVTGEMPVFLLDDVMSELDPERQHYILNHIKGIQTFITCCDPADTAGLQKGKIIHIQNGGIV